MWRSGTARLAAVALLTLLVAASPAVTLRADDGVADSNGAPPSAPKPPPPTVRTAEQRPGVAPADATPPQLAPHVPREGERALPSAEPIVAAGAGDPKPDAFSIGAASEGQGPPPVTAGGAIGGEAPGPGSVTATSSTVTFNASTEQGSFIDARLLTSPYRYQFYDSGGLVAGAGCVAIDGNTVECAAPSIVTISAFLGDGNDVFYLSSLHPVDAANIYGGPGDDNMYTGALGSITSFGPTYIQGDAGATDQALYYDTSTSSGNLYAVGSSSVTRNNSGGSLYYDSASTEHVQIHTGSGLDTINVDGVALGVSAEIYPTPSSGDPHADVINVGTGGVDSLPGVVNVSGVAQDVINVYDATWGFDDYTVTSNTVDTPGIGGLIYYGFGSLVINGASPGIYTISSTSSTAVTINGSAGDDSFSVGTNLDDLLTTLTVNGGNGFDALTVNDTENDFTDTFSVTFGQISRYASGGVVYNGFDGETLALNAQPVGSTIYVDSTAATTYVNANAGADTIYVGGGAMTFLAGLVVVDGGTQLDALYALDGFSGAHTYYVSANGIGRTSSSGLTYSGTESIVLQAGAFDSTINVTSTALGVSYQLEGMDGFDVYYIGPDLGSMLGPMYLIGGGGSDSAYYSDSASTAGQTYEIRGGRRFDRSGAAPITQVAMELEQLNATGFPDTIRLMTTDPLTVTLAHAGAADDTVQLFAVGLSFSGGATLSGGAGANDALILYTGGLGSVIGPTQVDTPGRHQVSHNEFESATIASTSADADGDGCPDDREVGSDEKFAGLRNPADFFDWYDVAGIGGTQAPPDGVIDLVDALAILGRFGQKPPGPPYSAAFDRMTGLSGTPWRPRQATGSSIGIDVADVIVNLQSFGHDCVND